MSNSKYISDYVYLAEASYADFSSARLNNGDYYKELVKNAISGTKDEGGLEKPTQFAELVTKNYTVEAHWEDKAGDGAGSLLSDESGFSGTLFRSTAASGQEGKYVLALKGTAGPKDLAIVDGGDIVHDGLAHHQIIDMYNFWQQIKYELLTPHSNFEAFLIDKGLENEGYFIDSGVVKQIEMTKSHNLYDASDDRYNALLDVDPSQVVVTGHSLGGHLAPMQRNRSIWLMGLDLVAGLMYLI